VLIVFSPKEMRTEKLAILFWEMDEKRCTPNSWELSVNIIVAPL